MLKIIFSLEGIVLPLTRFTEPFFYQILLSKSKKTVEETTCCCSENRRQRRYKLEKLNDMTFLNRDLPSLSITTMGSSGFAGRPSINNPIEEMSEVTIEEEGFEP